MESHKAIATNFEKMVVAGQIDAAYEKYIAPDFIHHNPFFKGDRESLRIGMIDNAKQFAHKIYEIKQVFEDGDFVITHARLQLNTEMPEIVVVHIYKIENDKIVETWDLAQQKPDTAVNENGLF
jgi:predicted SnoaL-like aldol condensation-catalyzing enzyme